MTTGLTPQQIDYIARLAPYAAKAAREIVKNGGKGGFSADVILAQWAHETNFGESDASQDKNNHAGIMNPGGEGSGLRVYSSVDDFVSSYVRLISGTGGNSNNYQNVKNATTEKAAISALGESGYDLDHYLGEGVSSGAPGQAVANRLALVKTGQNMLGSSSAIQPQELALRAPSPNTPKRAGPALPRAMKFFSGDTVDLPDAVGEDDGVTAPNVLSENDYEVSNKVNDAGSNTATRLTQTAIDRIDQETNDAAARVIETTGLTLNQLENAVMDGTSDLSESDQTAVLSSQYKENTARIEAYGGGAGVGTPKPDSFARMRMIESGFAPAEPSPAIIPLPVTTAAPTIQPAPTPEIMTIDVPPMIVPPDAAIIAGVDLNDDGAVAAAADQLMGNASTGNGTEDLQILSKDYNNNTTAAEAYQAKYGGSDSSAARMRMIESGF